MGHLGPATRNAARLSLLALIVLLITLLGLLVSTVYGGLSASATVAVPEPAREIPLTDVNPYGANFYLTREVETWKRDKTLRMAAEAGIGWVKQQFPWEEIEPERKGEFLEPTYRGSSWAKFDEIVAACEAHGLRIVARLDRPPDWTRKDNTYKEAPPDNLADYGDFVYEFVRHYRGRIQYIQVWNEPNIFPEWGNRPVDPKQYVEMLRIAYTRAKEADPNVYVLSAPLAFTLGEAHPEPGKWRSMNDLAYLEAMYEAGAADYFDILSANVFGMDRPPEDPPDPSVLNFQRVLLQRDVMVRYGDADKPVWFNEYGWNAAPESLEPGALVWQRVSEKEQAEYTVRGIEMARREWPWAGVFMIWYFRQVGNIPDTSAEYYFRMVDTDFTPRPVYLAVQQAARGGTPGLGLYQETHAAVKPHGRWENAIDPQASLGAYLRSANPGDGVTFTFQGSRLDLIARRDPAGGRLLVVLDGHAVPGLPTDAQGRSYVDLHSATPQDQARITLVPSVRPGQHTVTITVSEESPAWPASTECRVDAFEVVPADQGAFPVQTTVGLSLAVLGDGWLLWRTWRRLRWTLRGGR